ncbi:hypothetical protein [Thalassospira sp. HJ]|uniref:hypothetical protein n=1 Tax=Thalassospira sp. HJ TaxID=1616823 RepID=UPI000AF0E07B|nr:hypothetical protein [Thalassospira sp. HJ]
MNQEETLALWKQGKEAWNAWAEEMLRRRDDLQKRSELTLDAFSLEIIGENESTKQWIQAAQAVFSSEENPTTFSSDIDLDGVIFPFSVSFYCAQIHGSINFSHCVFEHTFKLKKCLINGSINFRESHFKGLFSIDETEIKSECLFFETLFNDSCQIYRSSLCGYVNFNSAEFSDEFRISDCAFLSDSSFCGANFAETADFRDCSFWGAIELNWSTFKSSTSFINCMFSADFELNEVHFQKDFFLRTIEVGGVFSSQKNEFDDEVVIEDTTFSSDCSLSYCTFKRSCLLLNVNFGGHSDFKASNFSQGLSFHSSEFQFVPDFSQTHFLESPALDGVIIKFSPTQTVKSDESQNNTSLVWRYRSLKRIAIQAHDHGKEQEYFAAELKSRRLFIDRPWSFRWWLNLSFEVFSDYGRSILRPLFSWLISIILFSYLYFLLHLPKGNFWAFDEGKCVDGNGSALKSAVLLSTSKALVFSAASGKEAQELAKLCLYGGNANESSPYSSPLPNHLFHSLFYLEVTQVIWSSILVFLILLGIRNHFKLK